MFKEITSLLSDPKAIHKSLKKLVSTGKNLKIDKVIGAESRAFFFGTLLGEELQDGFILVLTSKKLPYETISVNIALKYDAETLEIHSNEIQNGDCVLIMMIIYRSADL